MPYCLALGCDETRFWRLNPRKIKAIYIKAYELRQKQEDNLAWLQGLYFYQALNVSLSGLFAKKGAKLPEYPEKPLSENKRDFVVTATEASSEEEKARQRQAFFDKLGIMQANFELTHKPIKKE